MKHRLRTAAAVLSLALAGFGLTGCTDWDDDCDASSATVHVEPAGFEARTGGTTGGRGGGSVKTRPQAPKPKSQPKLRHGTTGGGTHAHIDTDDCEDDD